MAIRDRADEYCRDEPNPAAAAQVRELLERASNGDADAENELERAFAATLAFGTAGLRGARGFGTARMNRVMVTRAAWGLGQHLLSTSLVDSDALKKGVVVGFDARFDSRQFAEDTAAVLAGLGIVVHIFDTVAPTPLCAFALRHLGCAAAVVVTASHNPPADSGFKVFWQHGAQITAPHDSDIAEHIEHAPPLSEISMPDACMATKAKLRFAIPERVEDAYLDGIGARSLHPRWTDDPPLKIVYTAMHGVGQRLMSKAMRRAGFDGLCIVPCQAEPDPSFSTVSFPNPEEKGALDEAMALAKRVDAHLILANDPDADRLAVAVPTGDGEYRRLSGDDVGTILGADIVASQSERVQKGLVASTIVSSDMLSAIAEKHGVPVARTLTGFKWIAHAGREYADRAPFIFGYEEALGYLCGDQIADKDGISAAVRFAEWTRSELAKRGSVRGRLDALAVEFGVHEGKTVAIVCADQPDRISEGMRRVRADPPTELLGEKITEWIDFETDERPDGPFSTTPRANMVWFRTDGGSRVAIRPSGTEPKLKFYIESVARVDDVDEVDDARRRLAEKNVQLAERISELIGLSAN